MAPVRTVHRRLLGVFAPVGRFAGTLAEPRSRVLRAEDLPEHLRRDIGLLDGRGLGDRAEGIGR